MPGPLPIEQKRLTAEQAALAATCYRLAYKVASDMSGWNYSRPIAPPRHAEMALDGAMAGLIDAARCYDPSQGFRFTTYAARAMTVRVLKERENAGRGCRRGAERTAHESDLAAPGDDCPGALTALVADHRPQAEERVAAADDARRLREELGRLSEQEREVVTRYYRGENYMQIAGAGRSSGARERAAQLHRRALQKLRKRLAGSF